MFSTLSKREIVILATFNWSSANAFNLVTSEYLLFGKELNVAQIIEFVLDRVENVGKGKNAG